MSRSLKSIMGNYFNSREELLLKEQRSMSFPNSPGELPINVLKEKSWRILDNPNRFIRTWKVENFDVYSSLVQDILEYQDSVQHHAKIILKYPTITCEIYTHGLNDITEMDIEWTNEVDNIVKGYMSNV